MKIYCVTVEYDCYDHCYSDNLYIGHELSSATKAVSEYMPISFYKIESICIQVWEGGVHTKTLKGNGEEWDYEN